MAESSTSVLVNVGIMVPDNTCPSVPEGLKLAAISGPNSLDPPNGYPVLQTSAATYWAFSYYDNRVAMAIVAFDNGGAIVGRWDMEGARYIWMIQEDPASLNFMFTGQAEQTITMSWNTLNQLSAA